AATRTGTDVHSLVVEDFDGDGRPEVAWTSAETDVSLWQPRLDDPRPLRRRKFLAALDAAERGEEEDAARGFEEARLSWVPFDRSSLHEIRRRLKAAAPHSPSARRMAEILDGAHPETLREVLDEILLRVVKGRAPDALDLAEEYRARLASDPDIGQALNILAWSWVGYSHPSQAPESKKIGLLFAECAVASDGRISAGCLDTLAAALDANGRSAEAAKIEEEALEKCSSTDQGNRRKFRQSLLRYRDGAARGAAAASAPAGGRDGG
ncbi:MAG TPA: hypothetical protein VKF62_10155, partial [Planctomycetota bacterium]|nr:hypothetical protein [Planctomycetota bacterium]